MAESTTNQTPNTNIYKYTADIKYAIGEDIYELETTNIKTIAIDNDYDNNNMPMIFITLGVYQRMANRMILNQDYGIFILDIKRCIQNSDMPELYTNYISDKFIYFIAGDIDEGMDDDPNVEDNGDDIIVTIGLLSLDHVNKNKKFINGVLNGKLSSIMYYLTCDLPILIEPPVNNGTVTDLIIPPINSISKSLEYLNSVYAFYETKYRFFIDFNNSYLISSSGKPVKSNTEDISTVMITLYNRDTDEAKIQGMITNEEQAMYELNINAKDCEISDNNISNKGFSKISATMSSGKRIEKDLKSIPSKTNIVAKNRSVRVLNDNDNLISNMITSIDNSAIQLLIQKTDVDTSVLTINKEYIIQADNAYKTEDYNGRYILSRKRELYVRDDDTFTMNVMLLFKKVME